MDEEDTGADTFRMEDARRKSEAEEQREAGDDDEEDTRLDEELRRQIGAVEGPEGDVGAAEEQKDEETAGEDEAEAGKDNADDDANDAAEQNDEENGETAQVEPVEETGDTSRSGVAEDEDDEDKSMPPDVARQLRDAGLRAASQRSLCYRAFMRLERGRGHVTRTDVYTGLQLLGQCPHSHAQVLEQLRRHGCTGEELQLKEFAEFCAGVCRSRDEVRAELEASFRVFDADGSGFLERRELRRAVFGEDAAVGEDDRDFEELARLADTNGDGRVDYAEFCRLVTMGIDEMQQLAASRRKSAEGGRASSVGS